ncbi:MAG: hypothetical protein HW383_856, partial [Candidatus Magasanikbacteria bacterium]|nr:hypothetical protein [Candidatus Magasanikbacteria bacterium]
MVAQRRSFGQKIRARWYIVGGILIMGFVPAMLAFNITGIINSVE